LPMSSACTRMTERLVGSKLRLAFVRAVLGPLEPHDERVVVVPALPTGQRPGVPETHDDGRVDHPRAAAADAFAYRSWSLTAAARSASRGCRGGWATAGGRRGRA
jgi:hypothetical protein